MRVSTDRDDPGFVNSPNDYEVILDGNHVPFCVTADEEEGMVTMIVKDKSSNKLDVKTFKGNVIILKKIRTKVDESIRRNK